MRTNLVWMFLVILCSNLFLQGLEAKTCYPLNFKIPKANDLKFVDFSEYDLGEFMIQVVEQGKEADLDSRQKFYFYLKQRKNFTREQVIQLCVEKMISRVRIHGYLLLTSYFFPTKYLVFSADDGDKINLDYSSVESYSLEFRANKIEQMSDNFGLAFVNLFAYAAYPISKMISDFPFNYYNGGEILVTPVLRSRSKESASGFVNISDISKLTN